MAFMEGKQITDAILIANEAIDYWKVKKIKGFILRLDIEKAFETINWNFIDFMMEKNSHPTRWRKWIKACISKVHYSIIINGKPQGRIKSSRGIRQGNSISPFIFILAMDYLSRLLNNLKKRKATNGVSINENCNFNHLMFADDILFLLKMRTPV